jgi:hypothetical protein
VFGQHPNLLPLLLLQAVRPQTSLLLRSILFNLCSIIKGRV